MHKKGQKILIYIFLLFIISVTSVFSAPLIDDLCDEVFASIKVPMLVIDAGNGRIIDVNNAAADFYGYTRQDLRGMPVGEINILPAEKIREEMASALTEKRNYFVFKHRKSSGEICDVEVYSWPVTMEGRVYLFSIIHDVTDRIKAETSLRESEARLKNAEAFARFGHWFIDLNSGDVAASDGAKDIYGFSGEKWSIPAIKDLPLPEYREMLDNALEDLIKNDVPYDVNFKIKRKKDGLVRDIHSTAQYDSDKNTVFGIIHDVTEQTAAAEKLKRRTLIFNITMAFILLFQSVVIFLFIKSVRQRKLAQATLHEKSDEFDRFFNLTADFICIADMKAFFKKVNKASESILGYRTEEMEGASFYDFIHPDDIESTKTSMEKLGKNEKISGFVNRYRKKDGEYCYLEWQSSPAKDLVYAVARDITDRRKAEDDLKKQEIILSKIFEILPVGLWMTDGKGKLVRANDMGIRIWGAEHHVGVGEYGIFKARRYPSGEELKPDDWALAHTVKDGVTIRDELLEIEAFDGVKRIIINHTAPVTDENGKMLSAIVVNQDITDLKKSEEDRVRFEKQIQQTQKLESLGVLAGGIAHDFNNILMAVLGHAELALLDLSHASSARKSIMEIITAAKRASELSTQMLAYTGRASFVQEETDLKELIEDMVHLLKTLITKKAILNLRLESGLPCIYADPAQISQVIMNLIINASDAVGDKSGVITVSLGATRCDDEYLSKTELFNELKPGLYVHVEVSDTGCGMTAKDRERIFEPFYTTKFTGRGLGLAAVLGIVRAHKGAIKVYSEPGKGTNIKVLFPAVDVSERTFGVSPDKDSREWKGSGTVLFVDDEESLRALGGSMLERMGFSVIMAENGREAVDIYRERKDEIDLVILDLTMPRMDGNQAFGELRRIDENVKVVVASGYNQDDVRSRFAGKSLLGIIQKPYTMEKLMSILKEL